MMRVSNGVLPLRRVPKRSENDWDVPANNRFQCISFRCVSGSKVSLIVGLKNHPPGVIGRADGECLKLKPAFKQDRRRVGDELCNFARLAPRKSVS
jgi:hypothetical protein